jgi:hypothetical protein
VVAFEPWRLEIFWNINLDQTVGIYNNNLDHQGLRMFSICETAQYDDVAICLLFCSTLHHPRPVGSSPQHVLPARVSTWLSVLIFLWREWLDDCRVYREVWWRGKPNSLWEVRGEAISWNSVHSFCIPYLSLMLSLILTEMSFLQPVTLLIVVIGSVSGWDKIVTSMWGQSFKL